MIFDPFNINKKTRDLNTNISAYVTFWIIGNAGYGVQWGRRVYIKKKVDPQTKNIEKTIADWMLKQEPKEKCSHPNMRLLPESRTYLKSESQKNKKDSWEKV